MALRALHHLTARAAAQVLTVRHGFQMVRIHAMTDATEMIDSEAIWDRPDQQFIDHTVRAQGPSIPPTTYGYLTVAIPEQGRGP